MRLRSTLKLAPCCTNSADNAAESNATRVAKSALLVWDLKQDGCTVDCARERFAKLSKVCMDLLNNATYLYSTAIFSSLTMVSGHNAIKVLCIYAGNAVVSRIAAVWVLEEIEGSD